MTGEQLLEALKALNPTELKYPVTIEFTGVSLLTYASVLGIEGPLIPTNTDQYQGNPRIYIA